MTEEYVVATQQTIGTLITKPKMADKYLKKPPFRFLHDLVMEVTRTTSFAQGLYNTEESDAEQLKEKGAKLDFLNKAISATCFALGESIDVSASKIVAGLEPEKTNAWLVKLHQAATTCVGEKSEAAVQRVLSGELIGAVKEKKKKPKEDGAPPPPPDGAEEAPAAPSAPADDEAKKEEERKRRAEKKKREEERKRKEAEAAAAAEQPPPPEPPAPPQDDAEEERKKEEKRRKEEERRRRKEEEKRRAQEEEQRRQEEAAAEAAREDERRAEEAQAAMAQAAMADDGLQDAPPAPPGALSEGPASGPDEIAQRAQEMLAQQRAADNGRPRTAGRKPPKVTSKVTTTEQSTAPANVPAPVIIAEGTGVEDEEDMFEAGGPPPGAPPPPPPPTDDGGQHGALVSDLLAEKRKEEERERLKKEEEETREEFDDGSKGIKMKLRRKKDTGSAIVEVDPVKLGEAIQSLCQAANPLGKSIDLVHQDIANMGKELDHWKQEYRESSEAYGQQLKMTEDLLQPLYQKIAELDDKIAEQQAKIRNSRSRISKNDLKIQQLLESVVMVR
ncbi:Traf3ip1 [Symbiodinium sp. CCMP2456]|nr:Traf3ip1 [Symbiodinium sp. CCMP2456]